MLTVNTYKSRINAEFFLKLASMSDEMTKKSNGEKQAEDIAEVNQDLLALAKIFYPELASCLQNCAASLKGKLERE